MIGRLRNEEAKLSSAAALPVNLVVDADEIDAPAAVERYALRRRRCG
jgi:hypothetical protein